MKDGMSQMRKMSQGISRRGLRRMERIRVQREKDDLLARHAALDGPAEDRVRQVPAEVHADSGVVVERVLRRRQHHVVVLRIERVAVDDVVAVRRRLRRRRHRRGGALLDDALQAAHDVVDVARLGDAVVDRADVAAAVAGVEDHPHAGEAARAGPLGQLRAGALGGLVGHARGIVGGAVLRQQQLHRDLHRMPDGDARDVVDAVELHEALEDVADVLRVDAPGEADGHRRVERLALLQPIDGERLGDAPVVRQRR